MLDLTERGKTKTICQNNKMDYTLTAAAAVTLKCENAHNQLQ